MDGCSAVLGALVMSRRGHRSLCGAHRLECLKKRRRWTSDAALFYYRSEEDVVEGVTDAVGRSEAGWGT
jgi:hypothetical protein